MSQERSDHPQPNSDTRSRGGAPATATPGSDVAETPLPHNRTPAALRALAEAEERRIQRAKQDERPTEIGGQKGPDPVRYGDWEKGGIAWDF
ncbi:MAG: DUF1674 domain-containing protein [Hyphomicrobiaceae bacterium]